MPMPSNTATNLSEIGNGTKSVEVPKENKPKK